MFYPCFYEYYQSLNSSKPKRQPMPLNFVFLKAAKNPNVIALVVTPYPHSVYGCKWFTTRQLTYRRSASIYFPIRGSHAVAIMGAS